MANLKNDFVICSHYPRRCLSLGSRFLAAPFLFALLLAQTQNAHAQVDVIITPPDSGFRIGVPPVCSKAKKTAELAEQASQVITGDLLLTGEYRALGPKEYPEPLGACNDSNGGPFNGTLNSLGLNMLVSGKVQAADENASLVIFDFYLFDVKEQKAILGKRYQGAPRETEDIAHRFANEILAALSGSAGAFGSRIVFVSDQGPNRELFTLRLGSTKRSQLTEDKAVAMSPSWAPKGDKLVYTLKKSKFTDLFIAPSIGGKSKRITFLAGDETGAQISPDGKSIVTSAEISGARSIVLFNLRGRMTKKLTESTENDITPTWSPDGQEVAFASDLNGSFGIYRVPAEGGRVRPIYSKSGKSCTHPAWSPQGDKIAFICGTSGAHNIFVIDSGAEEATQVTFSGDDSSPSWSPDGRFLVYSSKSSADSPANLAIYSLAALKTTYVLNTKANDTDPRWAPGLF